MKLLWAIALLAGLLPVADAADDVNAFEYLNNVRQQSGLLPFVYNESLADAARNHANYLHRYQIGGHGEQPGRRGFTGRSHVDRIVNSGYLSRQTGENVSYHSGVKGWKESIDGLMSAIYHRFAFLRFKYDELGIGQMQSRVFSAYVYNFGNKNKNNLCQQQSYRQSGRYYYSVCADEDFRIASHALDEAEHLVSQKSSAIVMWPAANSDDIPPAFYEESPDPLPAYDVSGYPVSVQFNPGAFPQGLPAITRFQIFRADDNQPLETILHLNSRNDRHRKLDANEHALFPLQRLDWHTQYRVEVDYQAPGQEPQKLDWVFTTQKMSLPMAIITQDNQAVSARPGEPFAIYVPPRDERDGRGEYRTRYPNGMKLDIKIYDNHTLTVTVTGSSGSAIISFHGRDIRVVM